jgi:hypothetical protein
MSDGLTMTARRLYDAADAAGDRGCCGVVTLAVAAGIEYEEAAALLRKYGRRKGEGTSERQTANALHDLGLKQTQINLAFFGGRNPPRTPLTIAEAAKRHAPEATFIIVVSARGPAWSNHVFCLRRGIIHDWVNGRRNRIISIHKIETIPSRRPRPIDYRGLGWLE